MSLRTQHYDAGIVTDENTIRCDSDGCLIEDGDEMFVVIPLPPESAEPTFFFDAECIEESDYTVDDMPNGTVLRGTFRPDMGDRDEFALEHPTI